MITEDFKAKKTPQLVAALAGAVNSISKVVTIFVGRNMYIIIFIKLTWEHSRGALSWHGVPLRCPRFGKTATLVELPPPKVRG